MQMRRKMASAESVTRWRSSKRSGLSLTVLVAALALLMSSTHVSAICPRACACSLNERGHKQVVCDSGVMDQSIPVAQMENDIWRLVVTAPPDQLNNLAISRIFYKFTQLHEIHITNSQLPAIGDGTFKGLINLQVLNLTNNDITQILEGNFQDLSSLRQLHLDSNRIQYMPSAAFNQLSSLRKLTMARNRIAVLVPRLFLGLGQLEELDLTSNPLMDNVDADVFRDLHRLRVLRLSDCQQTQFNSAILRHLPQLEILDLSHNRLQYFSIDDATRHAARLKVLYLHGNRIPSVFNGTFAGLDLRVLTLAFNHLQYLQRESFANVTIRDLDLSFNNIQISDPGLLTHLSSKLQTLYIGGNRISQSTLTRMMASLSGLHTLGISNLRLGDLDPDALQFPSSLRKLNVSGNGLTSLPRRALAALRSLELLDLSNNAFRGLDHDSLDEVDNMHRLRHLYLDGNPWSCDVCHIPYLMTWLNASRMFERACLPLYGYYLGMPYSAGSVARGGGLDVVTDERACLRCASPPELQHRPIPLLDPSRLGGCEGLEAGRNMALSRGHVGLAVAGVVLFLLVITVAVVLVLYHRRGAEYYTHEEDRGGEDDGIYENPGVDDETGDLLNDKKTRVLIPPSSVLQGHSPASPLSSVTGSVAVGGRNNHHAPDGNGHAAHARNANYANSTHRSDTNGRAGSNVEHY